jgi:hypothetical protein
MRLFGKEIPTAAVVIGSVIVVALAIWGIVAYRKKHGKDTKTTEAKKVEDAKAKDVRKTLVNIPGAGEAVLYN